MRFSLILKTSARFLMSLILLFSIFLLVRGHDEPGGGFAGGLAAALCWALQSIAIRREDRQDVLSIQPLSLVAVGFVMVLLSGVIGVLAGSEFLTGQWILVQLTPQRTLKLGTPVLFDVGIFAVVFGTVLSVIRLFEEERF